MLKLYNVNGWGRGEIDIFRVDDYVVYIVDEQGYNGIKPEKKLSCWSLITGLKLETVIDVARNHETIADYVGKWPDISEYQEDELAYKVLKRVMRDNLFVGNDIMFEERKYFLLKMAY